MSHRFVMQIHLCSLTIPTVYPKPEAWLQLSAQACNEILPPQWPYCVLYPKQLGIEQGEH